MAVLVQEVKSDGSASGTSLTASGFAALAVNDLLISHFAINEEGRTITIPASWTQIVLTAGNGIESQLAYKIVDAGDVSGNSFAFSVSGGVVALELAVSHIKNARISGVITTSSGQANAASGTVTAPTVTPTLAESLLMFFATLQTAAKTVSGYAVATSSPTFTENYDNGGNTIQIAGAAGTRTEVTATGAGTATISSTTPDNIGQMVVVSPNLTISATETVTMTESVLGSLTMTFLDTVTATDSITSVISRLWTKLTRAVKTWTNQNKD